MPPRTYSDHLPPQQYGVQPQAQPPPPQQSPTTIIVQQPGQPQLQQQQPIMVFSSPGYGPEGMMMPPGSMPGMPMSGMPMSGMPMSGVPMTGVPMVPSMQPSFYPQQPGVILQQPSRSSSIDQEAVAAAVVVTGLLLFRVRPCSASDHHQHPAFSKSVPFSSTSYSSASASDATWYCDYVAATTIWWATPHGSDDA